MSAQDNLQVAEENFAAMSAHDQARYAATLTDDFTWETDTLPMMINGPAMAQQMMGMYYVAYPDIRFDIERTLADGNLTAVCWRGRGTQHGDLPGIPATHKPIDVTGCSVFEYRDGRISHAWTYWDTGKMLQQLGVMPAPGA